MYRWGFCFFSSFGARGGDRTPAYRQAGTTNALPARRTKCQEWGSNPRPTPYEDVALPLSYPGSTLAGAVKTLLYH